MCKWICRFIVIMGLWMPAAVFAAPHVSYSDITAGPNTGGENNNGAYLTISGNGFGSTQGSSLVTINGIPVANYKQWTDTQISVQPGSAVTSGPIVVTVNGQVSNSDHAFTVRPGKIFFVALNGNDRRGVTGRITSPFRNPQTVFDKLVQPGDHIVLRGGTWTGGANNQYGAFFSFNHKSDSNVRYDSYVLMGYPGETISITPSSGVIGINSWANSGGWTVANLHFLLSAVDAAIGWPPGSSPTGTVLYIRIVNNELAGALVSGGGGSASVAGRGQHIKVLGNSIHDNGGNKLYHGIYFNNNDRTGTDDVELAFNHIYNQHGGRGIQIYDAATSGITNVSVHHNLIHDISLDGILFGEASATGMLAYDNIVYRTAAPAMHSVDAAGGGCIRFNNVNLQVKVYNNTFYDCALDGTVGSGGIDFQAASSITLYNNIISTTGGSGYYTDSALPTASSNNLWWGSGTPPTWDSSAIAADPQFLSTTTFNFHLQNGSPAIDVGSSLVNTVVTIDYDGNVRPQGGGFDIGAMESSGMKLSAPKRTKK